MEVIPSNSYSWDASAYYIRCVIVRQDLTDLFKSSLASSRGYMASRISAEYSWAVDVFTT